jgi:hypothetical protein
VQSRSEVNKASCAPAGREPMRSSVTPIPTIQTVVLTIAFPREAPFSKPAPGDGAGQLLASIPIGGGRGYVRQR